MEELLSIWKTWEQSWQNPAMRHAMLVHFPIVLALLLMPLALMTAVWAGPFRKKLIICCFLMGALVAGSAWLAKDAGSEAHAALDSSLLTGDAQTKIGEHAGAAVRVWWLALAACGILLLACLGNNAWKVVARLLFFVATVALAGYIVYVADLGGRLVYVDQIGVGVHPMVNPSPVAPIPGTSTPPAPIGTPPVTSPTPSPPPPKPSSPPAGAAETHARQVLSEVGLYEAQSGIWYLKQPNNFSGRVYARLSTDRDVRSALRTLGARLPSPQEMASPPAQRPQ